jgi:hypothetical protein
MRNGDLERLKTNFRGINLYPGKGFLKRRKAFTLLEQIIIEHGNFSVIFQESETQNEKFEK